MIIGLSPYAAPQAGTNSPSPRVFSGVEPTSDSRDSHSKDPLTKRLSEQLEGLQRLQEMPKQTEMNKVGFLLQRLEALKQLLLHASPEQAKAIAVELKSIAKELASAGKSLGSSSGGGLPNAIALKASATQALSSKDTESAEAQAATLAAEAATAQADAAQTDGPQSEAAISKETGETGFDASVSVTLSEALPGKPSAQSGDDKALRSLLEEAKKLMKEVIGLLKPKLAEADKEAKKELAEAEKSLSELNGALSRSNSSALYTALGSLLPSTGLGISAISSAPVSISITV